MHAAPFVRGLPQTVDEELQPNRSDSLLPTLLLSSNNGAFKRLFSQTVKFLFYYFFYWFLYLILAFFDIISIFLLEE